LCKFVSRVPCHHFIAIYIVLPVSTFLYKLWKKGREAEKVACSRYSFPGSGKVPNLE
jgi:hypothetical protein